MTYCVVCYEPPDAIELPAYICPQLLQSLVCTAVLHQNHTTKVLPVSLLGIDFGVPEELGDIVHNCCGFCLP